MRGYATRRKWCCSPVHVPPEWEQRVLETVNLGDQRAEVEINFMKKP
jgi:hypothetical protein